jgi:hypothetical protein
MQLFWNVGRSLMLATNKDVFLIPPNSTELEILIWWIYTVLIPSISTELEITGNKKPDSQSGFR